MAKKKKTETEENYIPAPIEEQPITETLETNYMPYAMSVIVSRAIPEIDGLKPAHRKLLYTMYKMGLLTGKLTKSANVVGQTMKLNPHGDSAIYETMVRLTRGNEALLHPLIESQGNFGKQYSRDMAYAASRYTEVKLDPICQEFFNNINKNTVKFVDNYDGEMQEPTLLPVAFPNVLVNPNQGIAVGMASNMCSFNLREVCAATIEYLKHPKCDILEYMPAPDFSLGAEILYDEAQMREIYESGRGSFKMRSVYRYDKENNCIEIEEIPYTTTIEAILSKIMDLVKANKLKEIGDARDETDLKGFKLTLDLKRGVDPDALMLKLFKLTPLEDSFSCNFNILIDNVPKVLGVKGILDEWIRFRSGCIKNALRFDIDKKSEKLHLLTGLKKILLDIDKAISIIRHTEKDCDVIPNIMSGFSVDEAQAEFISEIKLRNLNKEYILNRTAEIEKLIEEIDELNRILGSETEIKKLIAKQLKEISQKYGQDRKTKLVKSDEIEEYKEESVVDDYPLTLFISREGYLKKVSAVSLRSTTSEHKLKEADEIIASIEATNRDEIIVFSDKCSAYKSRLSDIPDSKVSALGEYLPGILNFESGEKALYTLVPGNYSGFLIFAFKNGKMAKVDLKNYETKSNRKKLINAYSDKSEIRSILYCTEECEIVAFTDNNKVLSVDTASIPLKSTKSTQGVQVMRITRKGASLVKCVFAKDSGLTDTKHYKTKNIPAAGSFLRADDTQMSLF